MGDNNLNIQDILKELETTESQAHSLILLFDKCRIKVLSNSKALLTKLSQYYGHFVIEEGQPDIIVKAIEGGFPELGLRFTVKQPDPGKTKIKEEYTDLKDGRIVKKRLTGMYFVFGNGFNYAIGPVLSNDNQVINFINNRYLEWQVNKGFLLAHASGVEWKGKGVAIAGFSGKGKSTLALHFMKKGLNFISNDRLLVKKMDNHVKMLGIPKLPRVNPGTVLNNSCLSNVITEEEKRKFNEMEREELWNYEQKYDVFIDECFGKDRFSLSSYLACIVILNWEYNSSPLEINKVVFEERRDLLQPFMKSLGLFYNLNETKHHPNVSENDYLTHLNGCTVLELKGGIDFEKAVDECFNFLDAIY